MAVYLDACNHLVLVAGRVFFPLASIALAFIGPVGIRVKVPVTQHLRRGRSGLILIDIAEKVVAFVVVVNWTVGVGHRDVGGRVVRGRLGN